jgi:hypothetical protein
VDDAVAQVTVERVARDVGDEIEGLAEDEMGEPKNVLKIVAD